MSHAKKDPRRDGPAVFAHPRRLELAAEVRRVPASSAYELARALKRPSRGRRSGGAISGMLDTLVGYGVLERAVAKRRGRDVEVYNLNRRWEQALLDAMERASAGSLSANVRLIFVPVAGLAGLARLILTPDGLPQLAWIAESDDSALGAIVALGHDSTAKSTARAVAALHRVGANATRAQVTTIHNHSELEGWARHVLGSSQRLLAPS